MNRLVLIGNGFDIAHGLKTSYTDFIAWYWEQWGKRLCSSAEKFEEDDFCSFLLNDELGLVGWYLVRRCHYRDLNMGLAEFVQRVKGDTEVGKFEYASSFFEQINNSFESKGWVDIENEYYLLLKRYTIENPSKEDVKNLNKDLKYLQVKLIEYLGWINKQEVDSSWEIKEKIFAPIEYSDVAVEARKTFDEYLEWCLKQNNDVWLQKMADYRIECAYQVSCISEIERYCKEPTTFDKSPAVFRLPERIMLLNFNYTTTAEMYRPQGNRILEINYIHGRLDKTDGVIFGYGDELDEDYKKIQNKNDNDYLDNIKSIRYLESDNYKKVLSFIESAPFQICIMGHSCGNSDRTLLNTLFEHRNCISIKPYYYIKEDGTDNYLELVQNISRNFTDMKLMRDRVVNKEYTESLTVSIK